MATATDDHHTNIEDKPLEIFTLIWLDTHENPKETRDAEQQLRSVINYLKKFKDVKRCQQYIEQRSEKDRIILIASGKFGKEIVPHIHQFRQIVSIYIFCMDKNLHKEWTSKFDKIKGVVVNLEKLVTRITKHYEREKKVEEPLSINIFQINNNSNKNNEFIFSQIFLNSILQLKSNEIDKTELIDYLNDEYEGNSIELNNICQFEKDYSSDKVLYWYIKQSFFNKILQGILFKQNVHMIYLFRSFIYDISKQLEKYQLNNSIRVYRSEIMLKNQLKHFQENIGEFISINSFLLTTNDYWKTLSNFDICADTNNTEKVLFKIDADPNIINGKYFADISKFNDSSDQLEILFMAGSIFHLKNINCNDDQIWIIHIILSNDQQQDLKQILLPMKQQFVNGEINLQILAKFLSKMGKFDLAEKYLKRLLKQLKSDDPLRLNLYEDLAKLASQLNDNDANQQWNQKLIEFKNKYPNTSNKKSNSCMNININSKWKQNGITVAGGNGDGNQLNQLSSPCGITIDNDNQFIYIADWGNHRIVKWKFGDHIGEIVAGGNEKGNRIDQLDKPTDVIIDKNNDSIIISDWGNRRIVRWSRQNRIKGQILISDIHCFGLTIDINNYLYISDWKQNKIIRRKIDDTNETILAGGKEQGDKLNQLNCPTFIFLDQENSSIYVSDCDNNRVMKWTKGAKQGIVVAGGQAQRNNLTQLSSPQGIIVDQSNNVYVADSEYDRIMRWSIESKETSIIAGGKGQGKESNQLNGVRGLSFDQHGNIYIVDYFNHRVQKFSIE